MKEEIIAYGHPNILGTHITTLEFTKDSELLKDGDCIIGVKANKSCADLSEEFKEMLKEGKIVEITIKAGGVEDKVVAYGSPDLKLTHREDIVIRKSEFIDKRTLCVLADKSADELKRELIEKMKNPETEIRMVLEIK